MGVQQKQNYKCNNVRKLIHMKTKQTNEHKARQKDTHRAQTITNEQTKDPDHRHTNESKKRRAEMSHLEGQSATRRRVAFGRLRGAKRDASTRRA